MTSTGSFDWTTTDSKNAYVDSTGLHIQPTLTNESTSLTNEQILSGYTLNLTADGSCTGTGNAACAVASNSTIGTIINPVRSARLTTKGKKSLTYGKVEIVAKMPKGDWLWPAIWHVYVLSTLLSLLTSNLGYSPKKTSMVLGLQAVSWILPN